MVVRDDDGEIRLIAPFLTRIMTSLRSSSEDNAVDSLRSRVCRSASRSLLSSVDALSDRQPTMARICALILTAMLPGVSSALAQSDTQPDLYVAGRFGADLEGTDPGSGASLGVGGSFGFSFTEHWSLDVEAWVPGYITDVACPPDAFTPCGPGQFRDLLVGVSVLRRFGGQGIRPYVLVGVAKLWNQQKARRADGSPVQWTRNESAYPQGGVGLDIPLSTRLVLAPEVRLDFLFLGGIVRPNVSLIYRIR